MALAVWTVIECGTLVHYFNDLIKQSYQDRPKTQHLQKIDSKYRGTGKKLKPSDLQKYRQYAYKRSTQVSLPVPTHSIRDDQHKEDAKQVQNRQGKAKREHKAT